MAALLWDGAHPHTAGILAEDRTSRPWDSARNRIRPSTRFIAGFRRIRNARTVNVLVDLKNTAGEKLNCTRRQLPYGSLVERIVDITANKSRMISTWTSPKLFGPRGVARAHEPSKLSKCSPPFRRCATDRFMVARIHRKKSPSA